MRWNLKSNNDNESIQNIQDSLQISKPIATLLVQRGIKNFEDAKNFFRPSLDKIHDPFLMKDMQKAADRILDAIEKNQKIMVYGDYDVDGTTSVALVSSFLQSKEVDIISYIPDRYMEGYGVSMTGIDKAKEEGCHLIIALDCGIKAIDKVDYSNSIGIDFIICDHHNPGDELPRALAILDPKRKDCNYPYKELSGCGIGFKLIQAISSYFNEDISYLEPYLDLVATSIAADIVPITGENRILAFFGLKQINSNPRIGIKSMIQNHKKSEITITDVVFGIAPRINAAGRIKHGLHAVELLVEQDLTKANYFNQQIEQFNQERKALDKEITLKALKQIKNLKEEENYTTVVYNESWHKGVIGIVASRLIESYYRPTLVFTKSGDKLAASARSVKGFNIYNALEACKDHLIQFGGHKYAAGLTCTEEQYPLLKQKFEEIVKETIDPKLLKEEIEIDAEINLEDITPKFFRILKQMAPFGPGNLNPVFTSKGLRDNGYGKKVGADEAHLKLNIISGTNKTTWNAIGFNLGEKLDSIRNNEMFSVAYSLEENEWQGYKSIQLKIKDLKIEN